MFIYDIPVKFEKVPVKLNDRDTVLDAIKELEQRGVYFVTSMPLYGYDLIDAAQKNLRLQWKALLTVRGMPDHDADRIAVYGHPTGLGTNVTEFTKIKHLVVCVGQFSATHARYGKAA